LGLEDDGGGAAATRPRMVQQLGYAQDGGDWLTGERPVVGMSGVVVDWREAGGGDEWSGVAAANTFDEREHAFLHRLSLQLQNAY
jgi:hypothetical protein